MSLSVGFPLVIVAGLDRRWDWSPPFEPWLAIPGLCLVAVGYGFAVWAMIENEFFSGTVRIQRDRGHRVCDSGPYGFLRHPGYAGNALALPAMVLALGSLWTAIPAAFALVVIVLRTSLEDKTLVKELPRYRDYSRRVRYRLVPGIW
jgi:protein-S-isoprenylcysteine O-methyltransferase Ste14